MRHGRTHGRRGNKSLTEAVRNFENSAAADAAGRGEPLRDEGGQVRRATSETTSERKPDTWSPSLSPSRGWLPRAPARGALIKDCSLELGRDQIDLCAVPCAMEGEGVREGAGSSEVNDLIGAVSLFARQRPACIARWSFLVFSSLLPSSLSSSYLFGICAIRHALRLSLRISELVQGVSVSGLGTFFSRSNARTANCRGNETLFQTPRIHDRDLETGESFFCLPCCLRTS